MSLYPWLKALHVLAVIVWMAGMFRLAWMMKAAENERDVEQALEFDRTLTGPAMMVAWGAGFWLATKARWWLHPWFGIKFTLALAMAALHGHWLAELKRKEPRAKKFPLELLIFLIGSIVTLVIVKP